MSIPLQTPPMTASVNIWRPIITLGITQIVGFGTLYYAFGVLVAPLSTSLAISTTQAYGALSVALLMGSLLARRFGRLVDRHGAGRMMALGSAGCALAFVAMAFVQNLWTLGIALIALEILAPLVLYDAAFAGVAQAVGERRARRAITQMTLLGGFASTVFWPLTAGLLEFLDWRGVLLVFAGLHLGLCLPLHLSLPRSRQDRAAPESAAPAFPPVHALQARRAMVFLATGFSLSWAVMAAFSAQWVPVMAALGVSQAAAVTAGALMGPAQVGARLLEMTFATRRHPMETALFAMICLVVAVAILIFVPVGAVSLAAFAILFGIGQGLATMVRGTVPLALFGIDGYAERLGHLAALRMVIAALIPFAMAWSIASLGITTSLAIIGVLALASWAALVVVPRPKG